MSNNESYSNVSSTTESDNCEKCSSSDDTKHDDGIVPGIDSDHIWPQSSPCKSCAVFNKSFSCPKQYKQHIESENHKKKEQLQRNPIVCCTTNLYNQELRDTENETKSEDEIVPEFNNVNTRSRYLSNLRCGVCKKNFTGPEPYNQHSASESHKKKVELQNNSSANGINLSIASYSCKICNIAFNGVVPYMQHMESERHKKKQLQHSQPVQQFQSDIGSPELQEQTVVNHNDFKPWFCQVCKIQCTGLAPFKQHLGGKAHIKKSLAQNLNNELKSNVDRMPPIQESNFNANGVSEI